jgi:hypothetical protein
MSRRATGTFDVRLTPQAADAFADAVLLGRMTIDKTFRGGIAGASLGQMLTGMTAVKGSAGYVAIERVTGSVDGKQGSFILQHSGTMNAGAQQLSITVVPDSGTDELVGLTGAMTLDIANGVHAYTFTYALPAD